MRSFFTKTTTLLALTYALNINATEPVLKSENTCFTENKGQICDQNNTPRHDVLFSGSSNGLVYHLTQTGISYQLNRIDSWKTTEDKKFNTKIKLADQTTIYRVDINWLGAELNPKIKKGEELSGTQNYYLAHCPNGALNIKSYKDITYSNIYNGIDLKWYENNGQLEYDFIVKPNADFKQIKIEIKGAEKLSINKNGELEIKTPLGTIVEKAPIAYQGSSKIKTSWKLNNNELSFDVKNYNKNLPLVIDPLVRIWGTYYGGTGDEYLRSSVIDASGNIYSAGYSSSTTAGTIIATTGSHQTTYGGGTFDAYLTKFNSSGVRQFSTFYGGTGNDFGLASAMDIVGNSVYMSGYTTSSSAIASSGSHQSVLTATNDAFVVKFNSSGVRVWGTYYGGSLDDYGYSCSVDGSGNVFMAGLTTSPTTTLIATPGSHQSTYGGSVNDDAFLVKFNSAGVRQWGTYYGATPDENAMSCATDGSGNVYIAGTAIVWTNTLTMVTAGSHQSTFGGGSSDAYLAKFNSAGTRVWGTWYGGTNTEQGKSCTVDPSGNVILSGIASGTAAAGVISSSGAHQTTFGGNTWDAFLVKFNSSGVRSWGTYYGGTGDDYANSVTTDAAGLVYLIGYTGSSAAISTTATPQPAFGGTQDAYLAQFNLSGVRQWGTYYGGSSQEYGYDGNVDANNNIYLVGSSATTTGTTIASSASHQPTYGGGAFDGFIAKFYSCANLTVAITASTPSVCLGQSASLTVTGSGFTTYTWSPGTSTSSVAVVSPTINTTYTVTVGTATVGCTYSDTQLLTVAANPTVNILTSTTTICAGTTINLTGNGASTYSWSTGATNGMIAVSPTTSTVYSVIGTAANSCTGTGSISITVNPTPTVNISASSTTVCMGNSATLTANGATSYTWNTTDNTTSIVVTPTAYTVYSVNGTNGLCSTTKTIALQAVSLPTVSLTASSNVICTSTTGGTNVTLTGSPSGGTYSGANVTGSTFNAPSTAGTYTAAYLYTYPFSGCSNSATKTITVSVCTEINELQDPINAMNVYPNPNNGEFTIYVPIKGTYTIINAIGETVETIMIEEDEQNVYINGLSQGIYYLVGRNAKAKIVVTK